MHLLEARFVVIESAAFEAAIVVTFTTFFIVPDPKSAPAPREATTNIPKLLLLSLLSARFDFETVGMMASRSSDELLPSVVFVVFSLSCDKRSEWQRGLR